MKTQNEKKTIIYESTNSNILNDGWADDVPLIYPEESWKPDNLELTKIQLDEEKEADNEKLTENCYSDSPIQIKIDDNTSPLPKKKVNRFVLFLLIWLGSLSIAIATFLGFFYSFLEKFQNAYEASRPSLFMDSIMESFAANDMTTIRAYMTTTPTLNNYEDNACLEYYMQELISGKTLEYSKSEDYTEDSPKYYITADNYIVVTLALSKSPVEKLDYDFPVWYISSFEYYLEPQYDIYIKTPNNISVSINGIPVMDKDCIKSGISSNNAVYYGDYAQIPTTTEYKIEDFYKMPVLTAWTLDGHETSIKLNSSTGFYEAEYFVPDNYEELEALAIDTASTYANFISNDVSEADFENAFVPDCEFVNLIKNSSPHRYFRSHNDVKIQNAVVNDFIYYSDNAFYCKVNFEQVLISNSSEKIDDIELYLFFTKWGEEWKACYISF